jgi:predicted TIM-barrel fold metal-dependent hydrolase
MLDVHVHLAAFPTSQNGCLMSPKMRDSWLFGTFYRKLGLDPAKPEESNRIYIERLLQSLQESRYVKQAVILAMDGVYDARGALNKEGTEFLITNDYVLKIAREHPEHFRPGVSINPQRRDAIEELDRCVAAGATLVKVLPNALAFNPANPAYIPFWKRMAHHRIPLLSHIGYEFSLIGQDQSVGEPQRLLPALEAGVTVIAAHGMSFGLFFYEKYWKTFGDYVRRYPNFYWDASALTLFNRVGMLLRIRRQPELWPRMVFGTDYPLPIFAYPALLVGNFKAWRELRAIKNPFDRHARLLEILGLPIKDNLTW